KLLRINFQRSREFILSRLFEVFFFGVAALLIDKTQNGSITKALDRDGLTTGFVDHIAWIFFIERENAPDSSRVDKALTLREQNHNHALDVSSDFERSFSIKRIFSH